MAWDSKRPVPWKRLGVLLGIYAGLMLGVSAFADRDRISSAVGSVIIGVVVAGTFLIVMHKFGWTMPILRSRDEIAAARLQRDAARAARKGGSAQVEYIEGPKPKAAPTRRTSSGRTNNPRRTPSRKR